MTTKHQAPTSAAGTQLLDKALNIVELVATSDRRLSAQDIADCTTYPRPTVYRILAALVRRGMLGLDRRDQAYELGVRFAELASSLRGSHRLLLLVESELVRLSARLGETVTLGVPADGAIHIVGRYAAGLDILIGTVTGKRPYHATSIGKATLAAMSEAELRKHVSNLNFQRLTSKTLVSLDELMQDLQLVRQRGFAIDDEEIIEGVRCVGRALQDDAGNIVGAISVSAPLHRMDDLRIREIAYLLRGVSDQLAERLRVRHLAVHEQAGPQFSVLRSGGLFNPLAVQARGDEIKVVDGAAPALHIFHSSGRHLRSQTLPEIANFAGFDGDTLCLASGSRLTRIESNGAATVTEFGKMLTGIAVLDGKVWATAEGTLHFAMPDGPLTDLSVPAQGPVAVLSSAVLVADPAAQRLRVVSPGGKVVSQFSAPRLDRAPVALALDDQWVVAATGDAWQLMTIQRATGAVHLIAAPEQDITAMALDGGDLLCAGGNLRAILDDQAACPGSLYRRRLS